jgi:predicted NBD/HSP70 family sugar kinase
MKSDLQHHWGNTMEHYVGIDVLPEQSSVCVVDATGRILRETKVASEPEALVDVVGRRLSLSSAMGARSSP